MVTLELYIKVLILSVIFVHSAFDLRSQSQVELSDLNFHSEFEKKVFNEYLADTTSLENIIRLWLGVAPEVDEVLAERVIDKIYSILTVLGEQETGRKKVKKAVKEIFLQVHDGLFKKYEEEVAFHDIFVTGKYNCVTASGLYALVLDHFGIPYDLIETPDHVYIVVDPMGEAIALESTDPVSGVYSLDKKQQIENLVKLKLISAEEFNQKSTDELYATYFGQEERTIGFVELAADLYYNAAYFKVRNREYEAALELIDKSLALNPKKSSVLFKMLVLAYLSSQADVDEVSSFEAHFRLLEYEKMREVTLDDLVYYFRQIAEKHLIRDFSPEVYETFYFRFRSAISPYADPDSVIGAIHHFAMARSFGLRYKEEKAVRHIDSAYQIAPDDLNIQSVIVSITVYRLSDPVKPQEELLKMLAELREKYPFIRSNVEILKSEILNYAVFLGQHFKNGEPEKGFKDFEVFCDLIENFPGNKDDLREIIGEAYGNVSGYYVRKSDYKTGKEWLMKGLEEVPDSRVIERKLKAFEEYELMYGN